MIRLSELIANIFIELDANQLPLIIDLHQVYKIVQIINEKGIFMVDLNGASVMELKTNGICYFNFINETKQIVLATDVKVKDLKAKFRKNVTSTTLINLYKSYDVMKILGITKTIEDEKIRRYVK